MIINENTKVKLGYLGTIEGKGIYEQARENPDAIISLYEGKEPNIDKQLNMNHEFFKVNKDVESYYFFARTDGVDIFVEVPLVHDDELFKWTRKDWRSVKTLWTQLSQGIFRFNCTYYLNSKDVRINVLHEDCVLATLWADSGSNEDVVAAINNWLNIFKGKVFSSIEDCNIKNTNRYIA